MQEEIFFSLCIFNRQRTLHRHADVGTDDKEKNCLLRRSPPVFQKKSKRETKNTQLERRNGTP